VQALEAVLSSLSLFVQLRPDEIGKVARHFEVRVLAAGDAIAFGEASDGVGSDPRLLVVVSGLVDAAIEDPAGEIHLLMRPGDRYGESTLVSSNVHPMRVRARLPSLLMTLDRAGLGRILDGYPAVALPLAVELASELRTRNDQVRQVAELQLTTSSAVQVERAMKRLRGVIALRSAAVRHLTTRGLFRRLIIDRGAEPPFWMLVGFVGGLAGARIIVHLILKYKLEKHFFALVQGEDKNPMHIHHFNYGLILIAITGLLALSPTSRRSLRALSMAFGLGCGLVFDEFALFWNLNPDYSQGLSLISSALAFVVLVQLVYFRQLWVALANRAVQKVRGE
jgi:CRP-like cAMP-binding protein